MARDSPTVFNYILTYQANKQKGDIEMLSESELKQCRVYKKRAEAEATSKGRNAYKMADKSKKGENQRDKILQAYTIQGQQSETIVKPENILNFYE